MADELITKRLHVSGLTPSITPADLSQKLGSFGTVKALDGFGKVDALGQPRKFGYVTIETTKPKLARCLNLLSGVTWKGTKLRLGEAKPDFRERLAKEREAMADGQPPLKRRRLPRGVQGIHASDMSLVTPENVGERGGWKVTPLGRIVKAMRMRPEHPLPPPLVPGPSANVKTKKGKEGKATKKRVKEPSARARRRTIDPLKWGSTQLKGVFLENAGAAVSETPRYYEAVKEVVDDESSESETSEAEEEPQDRMQEDRHSNPASAKEEGTHSVTVLPPSPVKQASKKSPLETSLPSSSTAISTNAVASDLLQEKNAALGLLQSLFGDRDDDDWAGRESIGSDVDMDEEVPASTQEPNGDDVEDDIEVPGMEDITAAPEESQNQTIQKSASPPPEDVSAKKPTEKAKLKDLFAPQEEGPGFSLLGHLDLDLELDDDTLDPAFAAAPIQATDVEPPPVPISIVPSGKPQARVTLDASLPFFFPLSDEARANNKNRTKDPLDIAREKGWDWRTFCRTQTSEEIKQRWESQKVGLTQDWKRRHREAIKSRRRRGGGDGE